jgi:hypothetical protein
MGSEMRGTESIGTVSIALTMVREACAEAVSFARLAEPPQQHASERDRVLARLHGSAPGGGMTLLSMFVRRMCLPHRHDDRRSAFRDESGKYPFEGLTTT